MRTCDWTCCYLRHQMADVDMLVVGHLEDGHHRTLPVREPLSFVCPLLAYLADERLDQNHRHGETDVVLVLNCIVVPQPKNFRL